MKLRLSISLLLLLPAALIPALAASPHDADSLRAARLPGSGIKSNLLYDATGTLNAGIEFGLSRHWTLDVSANYNPWTFPDNRKWKHLLVQPEVRYWFGHRFNGHFVGLHSGWVKYNTGGVEIPGMGNSKTSRYEGYATGVGLSYGYSMRLSGRWALELSLGAGWVYTRYDRYRCAHCGVREEGNITRSRFAPTKAALSIVYMLGGDPLPGRRKRGNTGPVREVVVTDESAIKIAKEREEATRRAGEETRKAERQAREAELMALKAGQEKRRSERLAALQTLCPASGEEPAVLFPSGKADIDADYCGNYTVLAGLLAAVSLLCAPDADTVSVAAGVTVPVSDTTMVSPDVRYLIKITGYSSPDGRGAFNRELSEKRASALKRYLCERLPELPDSLFVLHNAGEDWEGVRRWVEEHPDMEYRAEVLRIIDRVPVNGGRKKQLMDLKWGRPYTYLSEHCFPMLRNACCVGIQIETAF